MLGTAKSVQRACYRVFGDTVCVSLCFIRTVYSTKINTAHTLMTDDWLSYPPSSVRELPCACHSWIVLDECWYPGTSVSPCYYRSTIDSYSYYICMPSMMYNLKNSSVVQLKILKLICTLLLYSSSVQACSTYFLALGKKTAVDTRNCDYSYSKIN